MDESENKTETGQSSNVLWWVIGIAVVLVVGYFIFSSLGGGDSGSVGDDAELQVEIGEIPQTGEGLIDDSIIDESDDVDLGEDLI